jgi:hypothetical protein
VELVLADDRSVVLIFGSIIINTNEIRNKTVMTTKKHNYSDGFAIAGYAID